MPFESGGIMTDSDEGQLTISFGEDDGQQEFRSWDSLEKWIQQEHARWTWLISGQGPVDVQSTSQHLRNTFANIEQQIRTHRNRGDRLDQVNGLLNNAYHPVNGYLRLSDGVVGTLAHDAREAAGDEAGAFAYAFAIGKATLASATTLGHFRGALLVAVPGMGAPAKLADRLSKERNNYRSTQRSAIAEFDEAQEEQRARLDELIARGKKLARLALRQRRDSWKRVQSAWQAQATAAVAELMATDETFKTKMGLQAPVEYWRTKAREHREAENTARMRLYWFFPLALLVLTLSFAGAAALLLDARGAVPSTIYVIVSGGLASIAALSFWVGRLLTKLYLSEHHLRLDAEERAVMTTTYLALTHEQAAEEADRQIILNALFRPTTDGLVREDGPPEVSIAALLARAGVR